MSDHIHPDPDRLHFACPACHQRAVDDQRNAEIAEATRFNVGVHIRACEERHVVSVVLGWPTWPPREVVEYYLLPEPHSQIQSAVDRYLVSTFTSEAALGEAIATLRYDDLRRGAPVKAAPKPNPMQGQPTLFG